MRFATAFSLFCPPLFYSSPFATPLSFSVCSLESFCPFFREWGGGGVEEGALFFLLPSFLPSFLHFLSFCVQRMILFFFIFFLKKKERGKLTYCSTIYIVVRRYSHGIYAHNTNICLSLLSHVMFRHYHMTNLQAPADATGDLGEDSSHRESGEKPNSMSRINRGISLLPLLESVDFSTRWHLCARKSPHALHPSLRNVPRTVLAN